MKPLTDFLPEVMPSVAGCPVPLVINAIRNSVIEFLKATCIVEQTITIPLLAGVASYPLTPAAGTVAQTFVRGKVGGVSDVSPTALIELENSYQLWRTLTSAAPTHAFIENGALTVSPTPTADASMESVFTSTPSRSATDVEDAILEDWIEGVAHGALYRLMALPGFPWANPDLAAYHRAEFMAAIDSAILSRLKGNTDTSLSVKPRRFG